jgi:predicted nuclease of predicted toxin-antitoxin system
MFKDFANLSGYFGKDCQIIHLETTDVGQQSLNSVQAAPVIRRFPNVFFEILLILPH